LRAIDIFHSDPINAIESRVIKILISKELRTMLSNAFCLLGPNPLRNLYKHFYFEGQEKKLVESAKKSKQIGKRSEQNSPGRGWSDNTPGEGLICSLQSLPGLFYRGEAGYGFWVQIHVGQTGVRCNIGTCGSVSKIILIRRAHALRASLEQSELSHSGSIAAGKPAPSPSAGSRRTLPRLE
jgi:hypothetical protein